MLPTGPTPIAGKSGEDVAITFDKPGAYGVKCLRHYGMGMVAMIVVGAPTNLDGAKASPQSGKAKLSDGGRVRQIGSRDRREAAEEHTKPS